MRDLIITYALFGILFSKFVNANQGEMWRGLSIQPEKRCSAYNKSKQYPYSQKVEQKVIDSMGGLIYGPYTGTYFNSHRDTDIEHIVAASEGHDSGLCSASDEVRKQFASDLLNLTLASPSVNRCGLGGKCGFDVGEWIPKFNQCWFTNRVLKIKTKYQLSVDKREVEALESILSQCSSTDMIFALKSEKSVNVGDDALSRYDDDNNGRISCAEASRHKIAPVLSGDIAYKFMLDKNRDGVVCQ
jgi:hypothetical protein